jgi:glutathione S-transferase
MTITITAFERSPDGGKGLARDTRVRWALEEVGQSYRVRLVSFRAMKEPAHLALHPFGQIPTYEEGDLALFETGSIVLHIAERHAGLLPDDANARARAITWMFAALNTVEPPILELATARLLERDKTWHEERLPLVEDRVRGRLNQLSTRLGDADWLDGAFSAGDLMMVGAAQVEIIGHSGRISEPGRLCPPRRSAGRLQAGFRRSIGGLHRQATDRLIEVSPGLEVVIRVFRSVYGS